MKCGLHGLRSMIPVYVSLSVCHAGGLRKNGWAKRIAVLFGVEIL